MFNVRILLCSFLKKEIACSISFFICFFRSLMPLNFFVLLRYFKKIILASFIVSWGWKRRWTSIVSFSSRNVSALPTLATPGKEPLFVFRITTQTPLFIFSSFSKGKLRVANPRRFPLPFPLITFLTSVFFIGISFQKCYLFSFTRLFPGLA